MEDKELIDYYNRTMTENQDTSQAVAAIQTLIEFIDHDNSKTITGLRDNLTHATGLLTKTNQGLITSIKSACNLFWRFVTVQEIHQFENPDFTETKRILVKRGKHFLETVKEARTKIGRLGHPFIWDGATILTHSKSRTVLQILKEARDAKRHFSVYVTESQPDGAGVEMYKSLTEMGVPTVVILDSAVGYIMEKVDIVLVGAEGVMESGGIINKIGTFTLALSAKELKKPLYVAAESYKFARLYPLNQQDIPNEFKYDAVKLNNETDLTREHPKVDYTPPHFITLLFTDLGVLTPSAVSDELIKLYL